MKNFLKTLLGNKNKPAAPPSGEAGIPPHLIQNLVAQVKQVSPLVDASDQENLKRISEGVQNDDLDLAMKAFIDFTKPKYNSVSFGNQAILISAQFNNYRKEEKDGLLDKQMVRQRKCGTIKQLTEVLATAQRHFSQKE